MGVESIVSSDMIEISSLNDIDLFQSEALSVPEVEFLASSGVVIK